MASNEIHIPTLEKIAAEARAYVFDFSRYPEVISGETISSPVTPAVSGLTIGSPTVTSATIDGVPSGKGVKVTISSGTAGTTYTVDCRVTTSGGSTLIRRMQLRVI
jgi:hypothetical protein